MRFLQSTVNFIPVTTSANDPKFHWLGLLAFSGQSIFQLIVLKNAWFKRDFTYKIDSCYGENIRN